jgi:hypothetical protein
MATYYVATDGNDSRTTTQAQSISTPWATWQKGILEAYPGDTIYIRGGVYTPTSHYGTAGEAVVVRPSSNYGRSGTQSNPINLHAYPSDYENGNPPILDCSLLDCVYRYNIGLDLEEVEYWNVKGLVVRNVTQTNAGDGVNQDWAWGINSASCANMTFENCIVHDIMGRAYQHWSGAWNTWDGTGALFDDDTTYFINCDAYNLCDSLSNNPGNSADGWKCGNYYGNIMYFEGCRAWNYSDDGFDPSGAGRRTFNRCWAMSTNTYDAYGIEGNGFKWSAVGDDQYGHVPTDYVFAQATNCIAADCGGSSDTGGVGFYINLEQDYYYNAQVNARFYNNLVYQCRTGFADQFHPEIHGNPPRSCVLRNNICYDNTSIDYEQVQIYNPAIYTSSNNTWTNGGDWPGWDYDSAVTVTNADFVSLDLSQLIAARKSDGSLPDMTFGHLASDSDLIGAGIKIQSSLDGIDLTLDGDGNLYKDPPSIGPFEYNASTPGIDIVIHKARIHKWSKI